MACFNVLWSCIMMPTYSNLPQEHDGVLESGWKIEYKFANFMEFLRILGLLSEASNPCERLANRPFAL